MRQQITALGSPQYFRQHAPLPAVETQKFYS